MSHDWESIERRIRESASSSWLTEGMKGSLLLDYEDRGLMSPVIASHKLHHLADRAGGVVSLSAGSQIGRMPPEVAVRATHDALEAGYVGFPSSLGYREFRQAIARKLRRENGIAAGPDSEIIPTVGAQAVLDGTIRILVDKGDDVLLIDPEYASIEPLVAMAGGRVIRVPLRYDRKAQAWSFDPDEVGRRVTPRTKLFIMSNGNNPAGLLYTREQLAAIGDLARRHDFFILSDEEYERLVFDGQTHTSMAALTGMMERTITAMSFSKAYVMTGFRIGFMVAPAAIVDHMAQIVRFAVQAAPSLSQRAAMAVLDSDVSAWLAGSLRELESKRDYGLGRLRGLPGVTCASPSGCYFLFPHFDLGMSSQALAEYLITEGKVSTLPGHMFGPTGEGHLRVSFCVPQAQLAEGLDRLEAAVRRLTVGGRTSG
ncbi:MAG: pyridoxal phosphate-dependent aminotransferase [Armatimonadetes bacterium]|nr:pyridoxal phosphate-dependent aminotransferase [Armatimonadota bacterium]